MKLPNPRDLSRRDFMLAGVTTVALASTGSVQAQSETPPEPQAAAVLVGPADARPEPGDRFFDQKSRYSYVYHATGSSVKSMITESDDQWTDVSSSGGLWSDSDGDGLAELPNHDGVEVNIARVGWAGLDSFAEEEDTFSVSTDGTETVTFTNTYRPRSVSSSVGADQGNGSASWYGWQRDADGNIIGMDISYDTGTFSSTTIRWHVSGNQTQTSYNGGA